MSAEFFEQVAGLLRKGRRVAVATVIQTTGSTPRKAGARMGVLEDGTLVGSVGGGSLEALVLEDARALLSTGGTAVQEYSLREGDHPGATGMVCGGKATVHLQVEIPPERLLVFGGGHVGAALARAASAVGFEVTVLDDRPGFLNPAQFPASATLITTGPDFSGALPQIDAGTYVAIVTRCHRTDLAALRRAAGRPASYIGLIGSRRKIRVVMDQLRSEGISGEALDRVRAPIGLPIGACTPEEIAVSITGEMIQVRRAFDAPRAERGPVGVPRPAETRRRSPARSASPSSTGEKGS